MATRPPRATSTTESTRAPAHPSPPPTSPVPLPALTDGHRDRVRREAITDVYRELGLLSDADTLETAGDLIGTLTSAYRGSNTPPALIEAAKRGTVEELTERLRAAAALTRAHHTQEKSTNTEVVEQALSLLAYEGTPGLHRTLGIHQTAWRRRTTARLEVADTWLDTATPAALAERAASVGLAHQPQAREQLPAEVDRLLAIQARWVAARRVRDTLIRHLYPEPLNQPALQAATGLTQAQVWQILNPGYRSKLKRTDPVARDRQSAEPHR